MDEPAPDASPGDRDAMEASERADDSIDRSYDAAEYEDEDADADEDDEDEDEEDDEGESEEDEEEEEEEEEELTGRDRFQKRDSDSDTDSLPSVPDGSPLPSDYDSDAEPEPEPIDDGPPPYAIPEPLLHKKLVVVVHELKGLPKGYGTNVFCTVGRRPVRGDRASHARRRTHAVHLPNRRVRRAIPRRWRARTNNDNRGGGQIRSARARRGRRRRPAGR